LSISRLHTQTRSGVFKVWGSRIFLWETFACFYLRLKRIFLGSTKYGGTEKLGAQPPNASCGYRPAYTSAVHC